MQAPGYDELTALMSAYGDPMSAAECHGILCGLLSCHPEMDGAGWAERMLTGELMGDDSSEQLASDVDAADKALLQALYTAASKDMHDPDLAFQLLLPDDDSTLKARTEAMAEWCEGFLYGLSLGGIKDFAAFSEQVQEFCKDLMDISHIAHEEGDDRDSENAFFEITEYVRMGALMVHDDLGSAPAGSGHIGPGGTQKITFH